MPAEAAAAVRRFPGRACGGTICVNRQKTPAVGDLYAVRRFDTTLRAVLARNG
jgi:hypothetical protein